MFNYYIKTLYRNERGIWQLRQWISRGTCACFLIICIYECKLWMFFYNLFIWIEYMDVFFIICLYEWNMWMLSVLFACMNGISECFLYCFYINGIYACLLCRLFTSMEFSDVFFAINLCELNMWMLSLLFVYMNGIVDVFIICLYQWSGFFFSLLIYMNGIYVGFLYWLSK
jgi:hypothetical protein